MPIVNPSAVRGRLPAVSAGKDNWNKVRMERPDRALPMALIDLGSVLESVRRVGSTYLAHEHQPVGRDVIAVDYQKDSAGYRFRYHVRNGDPNVTSSDFKRALEGALREYGFDPAKVGFQWAGDVLEVSVHEKQSLSATPGARSLPFVSSRSFERYPLENGSGGPARPAPSPEEQARAERQAAHDAFNQANRNMRYLGAIGPSLRAVLEAGEELGPGLTPAPDLAGMHKQYSGLGRFDYDHPKLAWFTDGTKAFIRVQDAAGVDRFYAPREILDHATKVKVELSVAAHGLPPATEAVDPSRVDPFAKEVSDLGLNVDGMAAEHIVMSHGQRYVRLTSSTDTEIFPLSAFRRPDAVAVPEVLRLDGRSAHVAFTLQPGETKVIEYTPTAPNQHPMLRNTVTSGIELKQPGSFILPAGQSVSVSIHEVRSTGTARFVGGGANAGLRDRPFNPGATVRFTIEGNRINKPTEVLLDVQTL